MIHPPHSPKPGEPTRKVGPRRRGDGGAPAPGLILAVRIFLFFYFLRFRLTMDRKALRGLSAPYLLIANHASNLDAFLIGRALNPGRVNFVTSAYFYRSRILRYLLGRVGAIPKAHTLRDLTAMRLMRGTLQAGRILMVFPEGRRTMDGTGSRFTEAMAKFALRSNVPVVTLRIDGSYLSWPRWSDRVRPGRIQLTFTRLYSPEALRTMSPEAVHQGMLDALRFNDYQDLEGRTRRYRSKRPADHIERLLHVCPDCREEMAIHGDGIRIRCTRCGAEAEMDKAGVPRRIAGAGRDWPDIPSWYRMQRALLREKLCDPAFAVTDEVRLMREATGHHSAMEDVGGGRMRLTREGLTFEQTPSEGDTHLHFSMQELDMLPISLGHHLEICDREGVYWRLVTRRQETCVRVEQVTDICLYGSGEEN